MKKKITDDDVTSILRIAENMDITQKELADMFGITQPHMSRILSKQRRYRKPYKEVWQDLVE